MKRIILTLLSLGVAYVVLAQTPETEPKKTKATASPM